MAHSDFEKYMLDLINQARANPEETATRLGIDLNEGLAAGTITPTPKPPLKLNSDLEGIAQSHSQDMIDNDFFSHISPTYGDTEARFDASSYNYSTFAENIALSLYDTQQDDFDMAEHHFNILFIDEGVTGRGHRINLMDPTYREIGIGMVEGEYDGNDYSWATTQDFGLDKTAVKSIVGFVFDDDDEDGFCGENEGLSSITINVKIGESTEYSTSTDTNGYYDVAVAIGNYTVEAQTSGHYVYQDCEVLASNVLVNLFYDSSVEVPPEIVRYASSRAHVARANPPEDFLALYPVNVDVLEITTYKLSWDINYAHTVLLDGDEVSATGTKTYEAEETKTHVLKAIGAGGVTEQELTVPVSVFPPFSPGVTLVEGQGFTIND